MNKINYIAHRINTIEELKKIPKNYGVEVDLRNNNNDIILSHDPFNSNYELFEKYLEYYNHKFLILNIKTEGIEFKILEILKKFNIENYFFLDCSFPMIYKLINTEEYNIALRLSEFESIETILNLKKIKWVWVDCFSKFSLTKTEYNILKNNNLKICYVSPELQNQEPKILNYKQKMIEENLYPDFICTKIYNINKWLE